MQTSAYLLPLYTYEVAPPSMIRLHVYVNGMERRCYYLLAEKKTILKIIDIATAVYTLGCQIKVKQFPIISQWNGLTYTRN